MRRVKIVELCWTSTTLYAIDTKGRMWFVNMKNGEWEMHEAPVEPESIFWRWIALIPILVVAMLVFVYFAENK